MKKFMQILLATFGVMALAFAGCSTTDVEEDMVEGEEVMEEEEVVVEEEVMEEEEVEVTE